MALTSGRSGFSRSRGRSGYVRSGSGFARVSGRRGAISGSKALSILRSTTPSSRTRGGYPSVYSTLTPLGKAAYWATRGMSPSKRGATIGAIEKSHRAPETLTARERELIRPHLEQFPEEFKRKFYQAERKVQQAKMETKVTKMKESLQPQELKQKRVEKVSMRAPATVAMPGVAMGLLYAATPETIRGFKQVWRGVKDVPFPSPIGITTLSQVLRKAKGVWEWKPQAEREYKERYEGVKSELATWEHTPEGVPITPHTLTAEVQEVKGRRKELITKAREHGWVTPGGEIIYPRTQRGEEWVSEYKDVVAKEETYLTPEGYYKQEYYVPTEKAAETLKEIEWLKQRSTELESPVHMAKERTEGYFTQPFVVGAAKAGEAWEKRIVTPVIKLMHKHPDVISATTMVATPMVSVPRYALKKGIEHVIPREYKPFVAKAPSTITDIPTEVKIGILKGPGEMAMFASEAVRAGEYFAKQPKEAAMIAPGVAAYVGRGMAEEVKTRPGEFLGSTAFMMAATAGMGKAVRPIRPRFLTGLKTTDIGEVTYKGIGFEGIKTPRPLIGMWKQISKTPKETVTQRALILGKEYPAVQYIKGIHEVKTTIPELGKHVTGIGKEAYKEVRLGREGPRIERMRFEGIVSKDYMIAKKAGMPSFDYKVDIPPSRISKAYHELERVDIKGLLPKEAPPGIGIKKGVHISPEFVGPRIARTADWSSLFEREIKGIYKELPSPKLKGLLSEEAGQLPGVGYMPRAAPERPTIKRPLLLEPPEIIEMGKVAPKKWGMRIEKPRIMEITELAPSRAYRITRGYDAFQIGKRPSFIKIIKPRALKFGKPLYETSTAHKIKITKEIPWRERKILEYETPKRLTEGLTLDISKAEIKGAEIEGASKIESLKDIYAEAEEPLLQQERVTKQKRKVHVAEREKIEFEYEVATETRLAQRVRTKEVAKQRERVRIDEEAQRRMQFEFETPTLKGIELKPKKTEKPLIGFVPIGEYDIPGAPEYPEREAEFIDITGEGKKRKDKPFFGYSFKMKPKRVPAPVSPPAPVPAPTPYPRPRPTPKEMPEPEPEPEPEPMPEPKPKPEPEPEPEPRPRPRPKPKPIEPEIYFELPKRKPRKKVRGKKKPYAWKVKNPIPELQEMFSKEMQKRRIV